MDKLLGVFRNSVCCRRCAVSYHRKEIKRFMYFTKRYEERVQNEERNTLFHSRLDRLNWKLEKHKTTSELFEMFNGGQVTTVEDRICSSIVVSEETYGIATALYGTCKRERKPHSFHVEPRMVSSSIREKIHKNNYAQKYAVNFQLCAAIQQMGCGPSDTIQLAGFLELSTGEKIKRTLKQVEEVLGPIQETLKSQSELDAVKEEVSLSKASGDLKYHKCDVEGYKHELLPKLKVSYGNSLF